MARFFFAMSKFSLEACYGRVLSNGLYNLEVTNDVGTVCSANDKGRLDLVVGIFEVHVLCEVCFAELLVVNNITGVVLDDQGELFSGGVIEYNLENDLVVAGTNILNRYLSVGQGRDFLSTAAVCVASQRICYENYYCGKCYCDDLCYSFHVYCIFIFTKLLTKKFAAGESLQWQAGVVWSCFGWKRIGSGSVIVLWESNHPNCYTNVERYEGVYKHSLGVFYYANRVGGLFK